MERITGLDVDLEWALAELRAQGFVAIEHVLSAADVDAARGALERIAHAERVDGTAILEDGAAADGVYRAGANQRVLSLLGKDVCFRHLAAHPLVRDIARRSFAANYGADADTAARHGLDGVLLSSITANIAHLGGTAMTLHSDQGFVPPSTPYPVLLNAVWPLVDFTGDNGATRVVSGSHRRDPLAVMTHPAADACPVMAAAGSVILLDGRTWHGTGVNTTTTPRPAILSTYCPPWVRPFSNHFLELSPTSVASLDDGELDLLGARPWFVHGHSERAHVEAVHARA